MTPLIYGVSTLFIAFFYLGLYLHIGAHKKLTINLKYVALFLANVAAFLLYVGLDLTAVLTGYTVTDGMFAIDFLYLLGAGLCYLMWSDEKDKQRKNEQVFHIVND
jgi:hypothetical protein